MMEFKNIFLKENSREALDTEIMFEIAAARADEATLVKLNIDFSSQQDFHTSQKLLFSLIRRLKIMKREGKIQFFATQKSFASMTTEAIYLINKYPAIFEGNSQENPGEYIYIKL